MELKTIEDYERVARAFADPNSTPEQYCVNPYGFCTFCEKITPYTTTCYGMEGGVVTHCTECRRSFGGWSGGHHPESQYATGKDIHPRFMIEIEKLHSREQQKEFFSKKLIKFIKEKNEEHAAAIAHLRKAEQLLQRAKAIQ